MRTHLFLASVATALLAGCLPAMDQTGDDTNNNPPPPSGGTQTPRAEFDANVAPMLAECASCHVGTETTATNMFLGQSNTNDSYYNGITNDASINGNFNPAVAHILTQGAHQGPAWKADQAAKISQWLTDEAAARGTDGGGATGSDGGSDTGSGGTTGTAPNATAIGAEQQWAACMSISQTEYQSTQAYMIANMNTEDGRCYSCHEPGGAGGAYWGIANNYLTMLQEWQTQLFITGAFEANATTSGSSTVYKMAVAQQKICNKGTELQNNTGTHPTFNCNQTVGGVQPLQTLATFATQVQAKADAGTCPPPAFATSPM